MSGFERARHIFQPTGGCFALALLVLQAAAISFAGEPTPKKAAAPETVDSPQKITIADLRRTQPVNFETEILPLLAKNCLACHKLPDPENGLVLESPDAIRKGGDRGPAVVPGNSAESRLLQLAAHQHQPIMPPVDNKVAAVALSSEQLGLIKAWIDQGAQGSVGTIPRVVARSAPPAAAHPILAVAIAPDDDFAACSRGDRLDIYNLRGPRMAAELVDPALAASGRPGAAHEDLIRSLAFNRQGDLLASGGFRTVKLWRRPRGTLDREIAGSQAVRSIAVSPNGALLGAGLQDGAIELHDLGGKQPIRALAGKHDAAVTGLAFAADGARLYSAGLDKTIRVWDVAGGSQLARQTSPAAVRALVLLPTGELATGDADNVVRIWNVATILKPPAGKAAPPARELKGHSGPVTCLAMLPGGKGERLLSGSDDGHVRLWNLTSGASIRDFDAGGPVTAVAVSSDGRRILAAGSNGVARLWNPDDGVLIAEMKEDPRDTRAIARANGAFNFAKDSVEYRKEERGQAQESLKRETSALDEAIKAKTKDEKAVADKTAPAEKAVAERTAAKPKADQAAAEFKTANDNLAAAKSAAEQAAHAVEQARKAAELARQAADSDKAKGDKAKSDKANKDKANKDLPAARQAAEKMLQDAVAAKAKADAALAQAQMAIRPAEVKAAQAKQAFDSAADRARNPERELLEAKNTLQGRINFIATATTVVERAKAAVPLAEQAIAKASATAKAREDDWKKLVEAAKKQKPLRAAAFSPDNRFVAVAGEAGGVRLYDALHGTAVEVLDGQVDAVVALAFAADGKLISSGAGEKLRMWTMPGAWKLERTVGSPDDPSRLVDRVLSIDFSPDGKLLATGGGLAARSGELKLWNVADGKLVREIPAAARDTIFCVRFSPDGQYLAIGAADRLLKVFRVADGSLVRSFEGHSSHVLGVAWQPDGHLLATAGADHVVKLWDFDTGAALRTIRGDAYQIGEFKGEISSISFIGNSEHLLVSCGDHTVRVDRTSSERDVRAYREGASFMHSAAATSDGKLILGGGHDGILHVWNGDTGYPIPLAK